MTFGKAAKNRMIFKILVLGFNPRRRHGFLSQAAGGNISCHLHRSIGVSLGVADVVLPDGPDVALQLWSLPTEERFTSLVRSFVRGHRAAVVLVEDGDEVNLVELLRNIPQESLASTAFIFLDSGQDPTLTKAAVDQIVGGHFESTCMSIGGFLHMLASTVVSSSTDGLPLIATLPVEMCPFFDPELEGRDRSPNTPAEIEEIRVVAHGLGLRTQDNNCFITLEEGDIEASMRTGQVLIRPVICNHCDLDCKRTAKICIIAKDEGWSSDGLGKKAVLTMAKIVALSHRHIPQHVEMQLFRSCVCNSFRPSRGTPNEILEELSSFGSMGRKRETLLDLADRRVRQGKLTEAVFNILKRRLDKLASART